MQTKRILTKLMQRTGEDDPRYYESKVWHDGHPECFRCTLGPAVLTAVYGVKANDPRSIQTALDSFDTAIETHQQPDGSFSAGDNTPDDSSIETAMFANELAQTYLILGSRLDCTRRNAWKKSMARAADYLLTRGSLTWYTNGNINLAHTMNMDLTYRITGKERFKHARERSLAFTLTPPQDRWRGFGLQYAKKPTRQDGSDGSGYLAESGGGAPGFDPAYTLFQANLASMWYLFTKDEDALRLTNLFFNQLQPLIRTSDWTMDVGGGTRRSAEGTRYPFLVSALPVLAYAGGRSHLASMVPSQVGKSLGEYEAATRYSHAGMSFGYGNSLAPSLTVSIPSPANQLKTFDCES